MATIGVILNPKYPSKDFALREVQAAASGVGVQIQVFETSTDDEIDAAFASISQQHLPALAIMADAFFDTRREKFVALAAHNAVPAMYHYREYALAGGLISYGIDFCGQLSASWRLYRPSPQRRQAG